MVTQGKEWIETLLSRFAPVRSKAEQVTTLDFEKPLLELDKRIKEVSNGTNAAAHQFRICPPERPHQTFRWGRARRCARWPRTTASMSPPRLLS